jgi:hypothetical protein
MLTLMLDETILNIQFSYVSLSEINNKPFMYWQFPLLFVYKQERSSFIRTDSIQIFFNGWNFLEWYRKFTPNIITIHFDFQVTS